ncbi:MAG: hypothetical protein VXW58_02405 [Pseudomonadota bacterium]|nr:hypothetical protein [Pseudomonadota bacterium]
MRAIAAVLIMWLVGCAPQDIGAPSHSARFDAYPALLFSAMESVCQEPADTFRRYGRDDVECRSFLPPGPTASIIVQYDGTVDDLPQLVMRVRSHRDDPGYVVDFDTYLHVPRRAQAPVRVVHRSPQITSRINRLMQSAGGRPN